MYESWLYDPPFENRGGRDVINVRRAGGVRGTGTCQLAPNWAADIWKPIRLLTLKKKTKKQQDDRGVIFVRAGVVSGAGSTPRPLRRRCTEAGDDLYMQPVWIGSVRMREHRHCSLPKANSFDSTVE